METGSKAKEPIRGALLRRLNTPGSRLLIASVLYQVVWFAAVYGATLKGWAAMMPLAVLAAAAAVQLRIWPALRRRSGIMVAIALATGMVVDTALTAAGMLKPQRLIIPFPLTPVWLLVLWAGFGLYIATGLEKLYGKLKLVALGGAIGGPLAYRAGVSVDALTLAHPPWHAMVALAVTWAMVFALLIAVAGRIADGYCQKFNGNE